MKLKPPFSEIFVLKAEERRRQSPYASPPGTIELLSVEDKLYRKRRATIRVHIHCFEEHMPEIKHTFLARSPSIWYLAWHLVYLFQMVFINVPVLGFYFMPLITLLCFNIVQFPNECMHVFVRLSTFIQLLTR